MVVTADDKIKSSLMRDGSYLKYTRSYGGGGAGLMTIGIMVALSGCLLGTLLFFTEMEFQGMVVVAASSIIGSVPFVIGVMMRSKRINSYMDYYMKKSGYSQEMLEEFDREFKEGNVLMFCQSKTLNTDSKRMSGFLTEHWFQMPLMLPLEYSGLHRVEDMAALFYEPKPYIDNEPYNPMVFAINKAGERFYRSCSTPEFAQSMIQELVKRNPGVITTRNITVDGVNYDCMNQPAKVAALFRAACGRQ